MAKNERAKRRRQEKKRRREKRLTRARNVRRNEPTFEPYEPGLEAPFAQERRERRMLLVAAPFTASSEDELRRVIEGMAGVPWFELAVNEVESDPVERAQELAFCALETPDPDEALDLAEEALELDPDNTDARFVVANSFRAEMSDDEWLKQLYDDVETATKALGSEAFAGSQKTPLGSFVFARPYFRTRSRLANELLRRDRDDEALVELEDLVRLDPDDLLGAREPLLGLLLAREDLERARPLLESSPPMPEALAGWARVIERRSSGDDRGALEALSHARELCPDLLARLESPPSPEHDEDPAGDAAQLIYVLRLARPEHAELRRWMLDATLAG